MEVFQFATYLCVPIPIGDPFGDMLACYRGTSAFVSVMKDPRISGAIGLSANLEAALLGTWDLTSEPWPSDSHGRLGGPRCRPFGCRLSKGRLKKGP